MSTDGFNLPRELRGTLSAVSKGNARAEASVEARPLAGAQQRLTYGDHFIRVFSGYPLIASWGIILPLANRLRVRVDAGDTAEEIESYLLHLHRRYANGWRECVEHMDGDTRVGTLHASECWPVRANEYAMAERHGFDNERIRGAVWMRTVLIRVQAQQAAGVRFANRKRGSQ